MSNRVDSGMTDPQALQDAEQNEACGKYAEALVKELVLKGQGQLQVDIVQGYLQLRIGQVHFQALLNEIARQTGFDMDALHREFMRRLAAEAERVTNETPAVHLAVASSIRRKQ